MTPSRSGLVAVLLTAALVAGCGGDPDPVPRGAASESPAATPGPADVPPESPSATGSAPAEPPEEPVRELSVPGLAAQEHRGDRLRIGAVRERTAGYTSYDVTYRGRSSTRDGEQTLRISGVLNVPTGEGPFPAVVLAHGYIDPAVYERGQGMTRERGYLAERGFVALHVDYRNHAESDDDPRLNTQVRLGYSADVINAVKALRDSDDVPVDPDRIAFMGRSMGGGVVLKALVAEPGLVAAAALWASVSSLEAENFDQFMRGDPGDAGLLDELGRRQQLPEDDPELWQENSSRPYFEEITAPVLLVHGRFDDTCPPRWARATHRALGQAGVESEIAWYDDGHAFGPAFLEAMDRTVGFLEARMGRA